MLVQASKTLSNENTKPAERINKRGSKTIVKRGRTRLLLQERYSHLIYVERKAMLAIIYDSKYLPNLAMPASNSGVCGGGLITFGDDNTHLGDISCNPFAIEIIINAKVRLK